MKLNSGIRPDFFYQTPINTPQFTSLSEYVALAKIMVEECLYNTDKIADFLAYLLKKRTNSLFVDLLTRKFARILDDKINIISNIHLSSQHERVSANILEKSIIIPYRSIALANAIPRLITNHSNCPFSTLVSFIAHESFHIYLHHDCFSQDLLGTFSQCISEYIGSEMTDCIRKSKFSSYTIEEILCDYFANFVLSQNTYLNPSSFGDYLQFEATFFPALRVCKKINCPHPPAHERLHSDSKTKNNVNNSIPLANQNSELILGIINLLQNYILQKYLLLYHSKAISGKAFSNFIDSIWEETIVKFRIKSVLSETDIESLKSNLNLLVFMESEYCKHKELYDLKLLSNKHISL